MDDDTTLIDRPRPKSNLDALLGRQPKSEDEPADPLPQPGDDYTALARPGNKPEAMLCFILRDQSLEIFSYGNLTRVRQRFAGAGQLVTLRFVEAVITEVRLECLGLHDLVPHLRQHRIAWIRERPGGRAFGDPPEGSVSQIEIVEVER